MGSSQKIVKGVAWTMLVNVVNAVYGFISVPILINHFGKAEYGLIGLAMSINVYLQLMDMGFNSTNVRFFSTWLAEKKQDKVKKAFQTSLSFYGSIGFLNALILFVFSLFTGSIFNISPEQDVIIKRLIDHAGFSKDTRIYIIHIFKRISGGEHICNIIAGTKCQRQGIWIFINAFSIISIII